MSKILLAAFTTGMAFALTAQAAETETHMGKVQQYFAAPVSHEQVETVSQTEKLVEYFAAPVSHEQIETVSRTEKLVEYFAARDQSAPATALSRNDVLEGLAPLGIAAGEDVELVSRNEALQQYFEDQDQKMVADHLDHLANPDKVQTSDEPSTDDRINSLIEYFKNQEKKEELKRAQLPQETK
jgi:hypothetical protein